MTQGQETTAKLMERGKAVLTGNYRQQPVVFDRGEGCWLWDLDGKRYLDMTAGIAVCVLGHAHPHLTAAITRQAAKLLHVSNLYYIEGQIRLAEKLVGSSFADRAFFCNSGAEANEAALKLARRYQAVVKGLPQRMEIIGFEGSFHGRTFATVALTGQEKYRTGFGPLLEPVRLIPFGDIAAMTEAVTENTCAVLLEPVQGEGGIRPAPGPFLQALRARCSETGTVLIFDEVQTGMGRTGTLWAYEQSGVAPDVMTSAKGLAGGVPMGAMLAAEPFVRAFEPGTHASTFGGNPLACAASLAVFEVFEKEGLLEACKARAKTLAQGLAALAEKHPSRVGQAQPHAPQAKAVRGIGLLQGLALTDDASPVVAACRKEGLLLSVAGGTVVRFAPPLIVSDEQIAEALAILDKVLGRL